MERRPDEDHGTHPFGHERDEGGRDEPAVPVPDDDDPLVLARVEQLAEEAGLRRRRRPGRARVLRPPAAGEVREQRAMVVFEVASDVAPRSAALVEVVGEQDDGIAGVSLPAVADDVQPDAVDDDVGAGQAVSVMHGRIVSARAPPLQH